MGATGTIGRATAHALVQRGHKVICLVRRTCPDDHGGIPGHNGALPPGADVRIADVTDPASLHTALSRTRVDVLVSCLASRTGAPSDAWAIDHRAQLNGLAAAIDAGATQAVLLSAICVQKPRLAFQHAKLAFEDALQASGLTWSIVRPTAFFKSLSGQVSRVKQGKPYLLFGDGRLTACKPISDRDLAAYLAVCLDDPGLWNRILPVGGPGPAITPRQQGETLFDLVGRPPRFRKVPVALIGGIAGALGALGRVIPSMDAKAEFARIAKYYATESMLLLDPVTGRYDAGATPSYGSDTLIDHYGRLIRGEEKDDRGAHAIF